MTVAIPAVLVAMAILLARHEWKAYCHRDMVRGLFPYTTARLLRRLTGAVVLVALGATFFALGVRPPGDAHAASNYVGLILAEVSALIVIPVWDFVETGRRAARLRQRTRRLDPDAPLPAELLHSGDDRKDQRP